MEQEYIADWSIIVHVNDKLNTQRYKKNKLLKE